MPDTCPTCGQPMPDYPKLTIGSLIHYQADDAEEIRYGYILERVGQHTYDILIPHGNFAKFYRVHVSDLIKAEKQTSHPLF